MDEDISRLRTEYADRAQRLAGSDIYSVFNRANLFAVQNRQRAVLALLGSLGYHNLGNLRILEMGCGKGGVLTEFLSFGASAYNLFGIDLLPVSLQAAHKIFAGLNLANANGANLPFPARTFDLVFQYTAISSILDQDLRSKICADMIRVTRAGGLILSYDFWLNPTNHQTRGLRKSDIQNLFPGCNFKFWKITLAPPITRRIVPISWMLAQVLENINILNSHYLTAIMPNK